MQNRLPAELPVSGERYDVTLTNAGFDARKTELAHFTIDSGEKRGVRVSVVLDSPTRKAISTFANVPIEDTSAITLEAKHKNAVRLSAIITYQRFAKNPHGHYFPVSESYRESNVFIRYLLTEFAAAEGESKMEGAFKRKETKFERKTNPSDGGIRKVR